MSIEIVKEAVIIGGGISGIAAARWLKKYNIDFVVIERTDDIGGLWRYRDDDYGVMQFTHINVSKYNYCFSDHQFPPEASEYPDHKEMYQYVKSYADKHKLFDNLIFKSIVLSLDEYVGNNKPIFNTIKNYDRLWKLIIKNVDSNEETILITPYIFIASGHHATPKYPKFNGQETFKGEIIHSVKFKGATFNKMNGKRVLVVGIGNSAVDVAVNLVNEGRCPKVVISSRSGAWIIPNYVNGYATDLYACRFFLNFPWKVGNFILENNIKFIYGHPNKYGLNPKMKALQTQPTLNPVLIHLLQRKSIVIKPNIKSIKENTIEFDNGDSDEFDSILFCTGYNIDINYVSNKLRSKIFKDEEQTILNLYKNVYNPDIGKSIAFIGFIQPTSGGVLEVSEIQARWALYNMLGKLDLPSRDQMINEIKSDQEKITDRFYHSERLTIQKDPILYNDEIAQLFNAKPSFFRNPSLAWRLMFSSCGPAQWRLEGPDADPEAANIIKSVPITPMMNTLGYVLLFFILYCFFRILF